MREDFVREYCDDMITRWRAIRDDPDHELSDVAPCYVDAYQSARVSLLGELLPPPERAA